MTDEPIFERLDEAWHGLGHLFRFHHDHAAAPAAQPGRQNKMTSLLEIWDTIKADAENEADRAKRFAEEHLPVIADTVSALASNPLAQAAMAVLHLSPDFLSAAAAALMEADQKLGLAKQAAADAQAAQDAALAAAQPAEPAPEAQVA